MDPSKNVLKDKRKSKRENNKEKIRGVRFVLEKLEKCRANELSFTGLDDSEYVRVMSLFSLVLVPTATKN